MKFIASASCFWKGIGVSIGKTTFGKDKHKIL
jgi:hypothetical protein